ncbi:L-type lectin-domain containing receptor kinase IV.1-like [Macadamia integrifolia]|uniref:L-type lectin-domain containing receptor kinase IV.1-like n=1 Tax=Macadamia integrifolia TaxID=60698 RepID=UPI001C4F354D|nr:L-type lectin-domain containing receptor kinase IV.1-like [Macadamia integrifolia]
MFLKSVVWFLLLWKSVASQQDFGFTYNGFRGVDMSLDGLAHITANGLLMLVNNTNQQVSHALYPDPIHFKNSSTGKALSFSTTFVFAVGETKFGGPGMAFVIAPSREFPDALPSNYFGLFNMTNIGKPSNHVIAIELDCLQNKEFNDIDGNHVGIDINDLKSVQSATASYFSDKENQFVNLSLTSGQLLQLWVEYYGAENQLNVTLAPVNIPKPTIPLLSLKIDLSEFIVDPMFVGFSSATYVLPVSYYVLGWSFETNGEARELTLSHLPKLPQTGHKMRHSLFIVVFSVIGATSVLISIFILQFIVRRKKKFAEVLEDWELDYRPHRFKYKDLYIATKGFKDKELLGTGDELLFDQTTTKMIRSWCQRFRIIKSVADALSYLHQEWEQVVVHRDFKSSNILLDKELYGRLGDFGLERLYDHGADPQTTHVVGTLGYLAPELGRTGKANPSVDVFAFGVFLLEIACGRRPIEPEASEEILDTVDPKLGLNYDVNEMELVLKLGLLCSHSIPTKRPHMVEVMRYLKGEVPLPKLRLLGLQTSIDDTDFVPSIGFGDVSVGSPYPRSPMTRSLSISQSLLSQGR